MAGEVVKAIGVDLSLTATGIAAVDGTTYVVRPTTRDMERLVMLSDAVRDAHRPGATYFIEGYSFGSPFRAVPLAELGGIVRYVLHGLALPYVIVTPAQLKRYATGKGNADKDAVLLAAVRRLDYRGDDHNEADALWLRAIGLDLGGAPVVKVPEAHRTALKTLAL